jgi:uncharacterized protein YndB with AHSA1/START domain
MSSIPSVRQQIVVAAPQARAFSVFTEGIDRWWPRQHHIGASPLARAVLEPRHDGRWYSVCEDGSECDVGRVLRWDPPHRLVLAWKINADWKYDPAFETEVEVTFTAEGPDKTRVELEHRNLERFGARAIEIKGMIGAPGGWPLVLEQFASTAAAV